MPTETPIDSPRPRNQELHVLEAILDGVRSMDRRQEREERHMEALLTQQSEYLAAIHSKIGMNGEIVAPAIHDIRLNRAQYLCRDPELYQ